MAATINMFVQGKPGWEPCALGRPGRKGCLCLAHWGDCSCSRNCCPVAGEVRRPSGPVGSSRCLGPLDSLPAAWLVRPHHLRASAWARRVPGAAWEAPGASPWGWFAPWSRAAALTTVPGR